MGGLGLEEALVGRAQRGGGGAHGRVGVECACDQLGQGLSAGGQGDEQGEESDQGNFEKSACRGFAFGSAPHKLNLDALRRVPESERCSCALIHNRAGTAEEQLGLQEAPTRVPADGPVSYSYI